MLAENACCKMHASDGSQAFFEKMAITVVFRAWILAFSHAVGLVLLSVGAWVPGLAADEIPIEQPPPASTHVLTHRGDRPVMAHCCPIDVALHGPVIAPNMVVIHRVFVHMIAVPEAIVGRPAQEYNTQP